MNTKTLEKELVAEFLNMTNVNYRMFDQITHFMIASLANITRVSKTSLTQIK